MHVAITGASSGIGEALVREFAGRGARITMVARRRERMEALADEIDTPTLVVARSLAEPEEATAWLEEAEATHGPIDVLVNNAGVQIIEATAACDTAAGERLLRLNLLTPIRLTRAVLPDMLARDTGCIVDIVSMAALAPTPGMTYYSASKGGLAAASEGLRSELFRTGVHVVTVYPGIIETDMGTAGLKKYQPTPVMRLQPIGKASVLAKKVRVAVERRRKRVIYPRFNTLARWFPPLTRWAMDRFAPPLKK